MTKNYFDKPMPRKWLRQTKVQKLTKKVNKINKIVKGNELKDLPILLSIGAVSSVGAVYVAVHEIAQGNDNGQRNGLKVVLKRLSFNYTYRSALTCSQPTYYRIMIVTDKRQVPGTNPTVLTLLEELKYDSPYNMDNRSRFIVHYDKTHVTDRAQDNLNTIQFGGRSGGFVSKTLKLNSTVKYNGSAANTIVQNGMYVMLIQSDAVDAGQMAFKGYIQYQDT